jgi:hypothetical protein
VPVAPTTSTRKSIRAAIVARLIEANTKAGSCVFSNRSEAWQHEMSGGDLPAISVYTKEEQSTVWNIAPRAYERTVKLAIECLIDQQDNKAGDDEMDDFLQEVEAALLDREGILHEGVESLKMTGTQVQISDEGERVVLVGTLNLDLVYVTTVDEAQGTLEDFELAHVELESPPPESTPMGTNDIAVGNLHLGTIRYLMRPNGITIT